MQKVLITAAGHIIAKRWGRLDNNDFGWSKRLVESAEDLVLLWRQPVFLSEGVTLRSLLVALDGLSNSSVLSGPVGGASVPLFVEEGLKPHTPDPLDQEPVHTIELMWCSGLLPRNESSLFNWEGKTDVPSSESDRMLDIYPASHGLGTYTKDTLGFKAGDTVNYGLYLVPVNQIADCRLVLNERCDIYDEGMQNISQPILKCRRSWTVGDMLFGIFSEIGKFGTPEKRDNREKALPDRIRPGPIATEEAKIVLGD